MDEFPINADNPANLPSPAEERMENPQVSSCPAVIGVTAHSSDGRLSDFTVQLANNVANAKGRSKEFLQRFSESARRVSSHTAQRARRVREERPFPALLALSGIAFAAGIALRVWRSR